MPEQVTPQPLEGEFGALAAPAHLAEPEIAIVGLHLDDRPHKPPPMGARRMLQRRLQRHGHGRRTNVGDLQLSLPSDEGGRRKAEGGWAVLPDFRPPPSAIHSGSATASPYNSPPSI